MNVELKRYERTENGTFGKLSINGIDFCHTLERPDLNNDGIPDNEKGRSCIPCGEYICKRFSSLKFGETFEICCVHGRDAILFHSGNTIDDTRGCVLLGSQRGTVNNKKGIINSKETMHRFMESMKHYNEFKFKVKNA